MTYEEIQNVDTQNIPKEMLASHASDGMLMLTAIMGVIIGILIAVLGKWGKQRWMLLWGIGLVFASIYLGFKL